MIYKKKKKISIHPRKILRLSVKVWDYSITRTHYDYPYPNWSKGSIVVSIRYMWAHCSQGVLGQVENPWGTWGSPCASCDSGNEAANGWLWQVLCSKYTFSLAESRSCFLLAFVLMEFVLLVSEKNLCGFLLPTCMSGVLKVKEEQGMSTDHLWPSWEEVSLRDMRGRELLPAWGRCSVQLYSPGSGGKWREDGEPCNAGPSLAWRVYLGFCSVNLFHECHRTPSPAAQAQTWWKVSLLGLADPGQGRWQQAQVTWTLRWGCSTTSTVDWGIQESEQW